MTIKPIAHLATHDLRHRILRPHQPIEACHYPADVDVDAFHLGAFAEGQLVGIASFYQEDHPNLPDSYHYRVRGMAVEEHLQGQGIGSKLMGRALQWLRERQVSYLWCNSRTQAREFYERHGLAPQGDEFDLPPIGPHWLMAGKLP